ncbi:MAG: hypothetical protein RIF37_04040 [Rhodospirillaceae bacterium]
MAILALSKTPKHLAAEQENAAGIDNQSGMYNQGLGVGHNSAVADMLYQLAEAQGTNFANTNPAQQYGCR